MVTSAQEITNMAVQSALTNCRVRCSSEIRAWQIVDYRIARHEMGLALWPILPADYPQWDDSLTDDAEVMPVMPLSGRRPFVGQAIQWRDTAELKGILGVFMCDAEHMIQR